MIKPIILKDTESGETFTLEFSRESVMFAERKGFNISDLENKPMSCISDLFFYAFRMHHPRVAREKTDKILFEDLGGLSTEAIERLAELYAEPFNTLLPDEGNEKNVKMTVEL